MLFLVIVEFVPVPSRSCVFSLSLLLLLLLLFLFIPPPPPPFIIPADLFTFSQYENFTSAVPYLFPSFIRYGTILGYLPR